MDLEKLKALRIEDVQSYRACKSAQQAYGELHKSYHTFESPVEPIAYDPMEAKKRQERWQDAMAQARECERRCEHDHDRARIAFNRAIQEFVNELVPGNSDVSPCVVLPHD